MDSSFLNYYKKEKEKLNNYIKKFNLQIINEDNLFLKENIKLFANLNSDGKLVRGTLINLGYKLIKDESEYSYPLALAFEIFQTAILVHDDIIDHDDLRRGKETIHTYNAKKYSKCSDAETLGNNLAICMGDLGLYYANMMISSSYTKEKRLGDILNYFNEIVIKTIKGEMLDVILPFKEKNNLENPDLEKDILEVYKLKTAYYTIIGPLCLGMILAGANKEKLKDVEKFGYNIGIAFQLQDDILGIYGEDIGKNVGSDIEEFKTTLLYAYTKKNKKLYNKLLDYYGKPGNIDKVREIFIESKALEYTKGEITRMYNEAKTTIKDIKWIKDEDKNILLSFIEYLEKRKK